MDQQTLYVKQHLIDPAACIRCNTCLETCSQSAIAFDGANYIVEMASCTGCEECKPGCPTGAIDNYRLVRQDRPYTLADQSGWEVLPVQAALEGGVPAQSVEGDANARAPVAPWSATRAATMTFPPGAPVLAKVVSNTRATAADADNDIRHIVLDFACQPHGVIEGQTIGVLPPGADAQGLPHRLRNYSVASARHGETDGANQIALTVKRLVETGGGETYRGVASNYLCDTQPGDTVRGVGPFGNSFLLPLHPEAKILMICVGTGVAPFRAFIQYRQRQQPAAHPMVLLYGGRSPQEMAYHDELSALDASLVDVRFAYSRMPDRPRTYVHERIVQAAPELASLLDSTESYIYICGLRAMEEGVMAAFESICARHGKDWTRLRQQLQQSGRLHVETY